MGFPLGSVQVAWRSLALVAAGGALGSVLRYLGAAAVQHAARPSTWPWGTTAVNVSGCLVIGLLAGLAETRGWVAPGARLFLMTGVLGGYTTFSTFGLETVQLLDTRGFAAAAGNVALQSVAGIAAVIAGLKLAGR